MRWTRAACQGTRGCTPQPSLTLPLTPTLTPILTPTPTPTPTPTLTPLRYTAAISALSAAGESEQALRLFDEMSAPGGRPKCAPLRRRHLYLLWLYLLWLHLLWLYSLWLYSLWPRLPWL